MFFRDTSTMRRWGRRFVALSVALLAVPSLESSSHDPACPHHQGVPLAVHRHGADAHGDGAHGATSAHGGCTCIGSCVVGASHPGIVASVVTAAITPEGSSPPVSPSEAPRRPAPRYLLPYANAPPGVSRV